MVAITCMSTEYTSCAKVYSFLSSLCNNQLNETPAEKGEGFTVCKVGDEETGDTLYPRNSIDRPVVVIQRRVMNGEDKVVCCRQSSTPAGVDDVCR